ncbi:hypothetical protein [Candidatus Poriferisocius sp.]|uniref:hypothetical protein n=1 Tax=Candidatus Poriferisocius sp. TaxID=3101276 RepID=UPI003B01582B
MAGGTWNGRDFYVVLGRTDEGDYRWPIAGEYGLLNAGGGSRYWKPLQNLKPGHRVFAYVGGAGYVGIGRVTGEMIMARDAIVEVAGENLPLLAQPELSSEFKERALSGDLDLAERVVPTNWLVKRPFHEAVWERGMFASQWIACKLRDENTIAAVESAFGIDLSTT